MIFDWRTSAHVSCVATSLFIYFPYDRTGPFFPKCGVEKSTYTLYIFTTHVTSQWIHF